MTLEAVREKALQLRDQLLNNTSDHIDRLRLEKFRASNCWLESFKKRFYIKQKTISGTEDLLCPALVNEARCKIQEEVRNYFPENIFNADETALFYNQLPTRTLVVGNNPVKEQKTSKERITIIFCCSATGEKLQPLVVGKYERPRALKDIDISLLRCKYKWNQNAWITRILFQEWAEQLNDIMKRVNRNICLLLDNFSGHKYLPKYSNVKICYFSPGMTSLLQPLDCGIIRSFKATYRRKLVAFELEQPNKTASNKFNIKSAIDYVAAAWEEVSSEVIRNCWSHANVTNPLSTLLSVACI